MNDDVNAVGVPSPLSSASRREFQNVSMPQVVTAASASTSIDVGVDYFMAVVHDEIVDADDKNDLNFDNDITNDFAASSPS